MGKVSKNKSFNKDPNKFNKQGTKYSGKLAGAIQRANQMHYNRSVAGRLENAARESLQAGEAKQINPTAASVQARGLLLEGNRSSLLQNAKQNKLDSSGLNELAQANKQLGFNETEGMGPIESVKYQVTNPEFKKDLKKTSQRLRKIPTISNILLNALGVGSGNKLLD